MKKEVILNQIITDLTELLKDVESGLYDENEESFIESWDKVHKKFKEFQNSFEKEIKVVQEKTAQILRQMEVLEMTVKLRRMLNCNVKIGFPLEE